MKTWTNYFTWDLFHHIFIFSFLSLSFLIFGRLWSPLTFQLIVSYKYEQNPRVFTEHKNLAIDFKAAGFHISGRQVASHTRLLLT